MATVNDVKQKMLDRMAAMDMTHMSLADMAQCVCILRSLSDIGDESLCQSLMEMYRTSINNVHSDRPLEGLAMGATDNGGE